MAVNTTLKEPGAAMVTAAPLAVQVKMLLETPQLMFALLVIPLNVPGVGLP